MQGFQRGHKQADSYGGPGSQWALPPLSPLETLALQAGFVAQGATDAMRLTVAGQHLTNDKVRAPLSSPSSASTLVADVPRSPPSSSRPRR